MAPASPARPVTGVAPANGRPSRRPRRYDPTRPEPEYAFEVVDDFIVRKPVGAREISIATVLHDALSPVVRAAGLGRVYPGIGYALPGGQGRKPDVSFLSFARWADGRAFPPGDFLPVVPELAVEVVSPREKTYATLAKVLEYFAAGVSAVWLVLPDIQHVYCYDSAAAVRVLTRADDLTGGPVVPGFRMPVAELLPPAPAPR